LKPKYTIFLYVSTLVLILDQASKIYIDRTMELYSSMSSSGFLCHHLRRNKGRRSALSESAYRLPVLTLISVIAIIAILVFSVASPRPEIHRILPIAHLPAHWATSSTASASAGDRFLPGPLA
jgi:lipoprotein signal peptidase